MYILGVSTDPATATIYYIMVVIFGAMFIVNLFLAVIFEAFIENTPEDMESEAKEEVGSLEIVRDDPKNRLLSTNASPSSDPVQTSRPAEAHAPSATFTPTPQAPPKWEPYAAYDPLKRRTAAPVPVACEPTPETEPRSAAASAALSSSQSRSRRPPVPPIAKRPG